MKHTQNYYTELSDGSGIRISIYAQPRASRTELIGLHNGSLKVKVNAPPVEGAANAALIVFFSELLGIPQSRIHVAQGALSRYKALELQGEPKKLIEKTSGLIAERG